mgnify:CR=1 FL=1
MQQATGMLALGLENPITKRCNRTASDKASAHFGAVCFISPDCNGRGSAVISQGKPENRGVIFSYDFSNPRPPFPWRYFCFYNKEQGK